MRSRSRTASSAASSSASIASTRSPRTELAGKAGPGALSTHAPVTSIDAEQLHLEDQRGIGWNYAARTARPIAQIRRNGELACAAHLHALDAFVPTFDDAP